VDNQEWAALPESAQVALERFLEAELLNSQVRLVREESPEAMLRRQGEAQFLSRKLGEVRDFAAKAKEPENGRRNASY
jgi:hypothetical protein